MIHPKNEPSVTFATPNEVLTFVRECLRTQDVDRLYKAALDETSDFWRQRIFDDLCAIDTDESLEAVFLTDDDFPDARNEYKLGGHSTRTRHLHLDLIRRNDAWRLKLIWKCR